MSIRVVHVHSFTVSTYIRLLGRDVGFAEISHSIIVTHLRKNVAVCAVDSTKKPYHRHQI